MKCAVCKTGRLEQSGSHLYCNNCNFVAFTVTDDYIEASAGLLSVLISNTKFTSDKAKIEVVLQHIQRHLPQLDAYLGNIERGQANFMADLIERISAQAINVQTENDLICRCGSKDFNMEKVSTINCKSCNARYEFDEEQGIYTPAFLCKCGSVTYHYMEQGSHIVLCDECGKMYAHNLKQDVFYQWGE